MYYCYRFLFFLLLFLMYLLFLSSFMFCIIYFILFYFFCFFFFFKQKTAYVMRISDWSSDVCSSDLLAEVVYVDGFGNAMTGLDAAALAEADVLVAGGRSLRHARVFSAVPPGAAFWYENSSGLVEIAVNQGNAAVMLGLRIGDRKSTRLNSSH